MSHPVQRRRGNVEPDGDVRCSQNDIICHLNYRLASSPHIYGGEGWWRTATPTWKRRRDTKWREKPSTEKGCRVLLDLMATLDFIHHLTIHSVASLSDGCFLSVDWSLRPCVNETLAYYKCYLSCSLASSEPCGSLQHPKKVVGPLTGNNEGHLSRDIHPVPLWWGFQLISPPSRGKKKNHIKPKVIKYCQHGSCCLEPVLRALSNKLIGVMALPCWGAFKAAIL